jgi:hypothetical protein
MIISPTKFVRRRAACIKAAKGWSRDKLLSEYTLLSDYCTQLFMEAHALRRDAARRHDS